MPQEKAMRKGRAIIAGRKKTPGKCLTIPPDRKRPPSTDFCGESVPYFQREGKGPSEESHASRRGRQSGGGGGGRNTRIFRKRVQ